MGRKSRKQIVGPEEDVEQAAHEQEYAELETELHAAWQTRTEDDQTVDTDPVDALNKADA